MVQSEICCTVYSVPFCFWDSIVQIFCFSFFILVVLSSALLCLLFISLTLCVVFPLLNFRNCPNALFLAMFSRTDIRWSRRLLRMWIEHFDDGWLVSSISFMLRIECCDDGWLVRSVSFRLRV